MRFKNLRLNSIRIKLIISLVGICILPLSILGIGTYNQSKSILNEKLNLTTTQTLTEVNNSVTTYFHGLGDMISLLATDDGFQNIEIEDTSDDVLTILSKVKNTDKDIFTSYFATADKRFLVYPSQKLPDGYDATTKQWYKQAIEHPRQAIISSPYKDASSGQIVVTLAETVENNGKIVGVTGLDITVDTLIDRMAISKVGNSGYVFISDIDGNIISHPNKNLIDQNVSSQLPFWDKVKSGNSGFVNYSTNNKIKFGAYQTNTITGWKLVATLDQSELTNDTKSILNIALLILLIMGLISIFMSLVLSKGIASNIKILKEVFFKASQGDLTVSASASTKDEFKDLAASFNIMMEDISGLINSVTKSSNTVLDTSTILASMSEEVTASMGEVAKAIDEVSTGSNEQAQNAQKGVSQMDELSNRLDKISINSNEMDKISSNTKDLGTKGLYMIDALIEKSNKTKMATTEVNDIVQAMNDSTKEINAISETISNITAQTNLLSLNASIESARAGEAGKGFAIVAQEIRKLAEQSKASTEEIKAIISSIQRKTDTAVNAIKSTQTIVNEQELAVCETKDIFNDILKSIQVMITKVDEVDESIADMNVEKQSTIVEIENISAISQQTASASEEVTASAEEIKSTIEELANSSTNLQRLAEQLGREINKFKTN